MRLRRLQLAAELILAVAVCSFIPRLQEVDEPRRVLLPDRAPVTIGGLRVGSRCPEVADEVVVTLYANHGLVSSVYGERLEIGRSRLRKGSTAEQVSEWFGDPDRIEQVDRSPDRCLTWFYERRGLTVAMDSSNRVVNGGFSLDPVPPRVALHLARATHELGCPSDDHLDWIPRNGQGRFAGRPELVRALAESGTHVLAARNLRGD